MMSMMLLDRLVVILLFLLQGNVSEGWSSVSPEKGSPPSQELSGRREATIGRTRIPDNKQSTCCRRSIIGSALLGLSSLVSLQAAPSNAAPPIGVMMEELGYFPVRSSGGDVEYVPARIQRDSSPQAIELAKYMQKQKISMAGAYWCPHCRRQRELFGRQAWAMISYQECASQGYQHTSCPAKVTGYPTWLKRGEVVATGELPLGVLAEKVGFQGFDDSLEQNVPPLIGSASCGK